MPGKKSNIPAELDSLGEAIERLRKDVNRDRKTRGFDKVEADRTRRGTTRANHEAARAHRRVDGLESKFNAGIKSVTEFVGLFQTRVSNLNADSALHEQQITEHDKRIKGLEKATSSNNRGSIIATWLAVLISVSIGMLIAHAYLAERYTAFYQGRTIDIGAHPGYDAIFWAAGLVAVVATTVAAIVAASSGSNSSRSSIKTSSSSKSSATSSTDSSAVAEDYVYVDTTATTPTKVAPVVRV